MAARLTRLLVALGLLLGAALPSPAAAAVVRLPTSHETVTSVVPDRGADPAYASSYFGARYYRADIGRFTTIEPVYTWQENLEDPQRWNRYAYARNNPPKFVNPDGRVPLALPIDLFGLDKAVAAIRARVKELLGSGTVATIADGALGGLLPVTAEEKMQSLITAAMPAVLQARLVRREGESAAAALGRRAHVNYGAALGAEGDYQLRVVLESGRRPDAVDWAAHVVRELKPDNANAIARGWRQVERYRSELQRLTGAVWTSFVDTYQSMVNR